jgi:Mn2+/Fe2+ NRAMP family transporter
MMMVLTQNPKIMGKFTLPPYLRWVGWLATAVMLLASLGLIITSVAWK